MEQETNKIISFIKTTFEEANFSKAVIGISGGLDSAVIATLLVRALGKENVLGFLLPHHLQRDASDAGSFARSLGIPWEVINIGDIVDITTQYAGIPEDDYLRIGNIKARTRMMLLYDLSSLHKALVVGTGNKTELTLGYFTLHGDGACALEPIGHLYTTQVKQLAKYPGVPKKIVDKVPSAGLWPGQTDEEELGASYEDIDKILIAREESDLDTLEKCDKSLCKKLLSQSLNNEFKLKPAKILK